MSSGLCLVGSVLWVCLLGYVWWALSCGYVWWAMSGGLCLRYMDLTLMIFMENRKKKYISGDYIWWLYAEERRLGHVQLSVFEREGFEICNVWYSLTASSQWNSRSPLRPGKVGCQQLFSLWIEAFYIIYGWLLYLVGFYGGLGITKATWNNMQCLISVIKTWCSLNCTLATVNNNIIMLYILPPIGRNPPFCFYFFKKPI